MHRTPEPRQSARFHLRAAGYVSCLTLAALALGAVACTSTTGPKERAAGPSYSGTDAEGVPVHTDTAPTPRTGTDAAVPDVCAAEVRADTVEPTETARYLALGDSYTIGESVPEDERYPVQLVERLRADGIAIDDAEIIARTGWTTDELSRAIDAQDPQGPYELVTLLIGVNNQYRGRPVDSYTPGFIDLLERSIEFAGGDPTRVVVISIPDYGATPFGQQGDAAQTGRELDAYNAAARAEVERLGAHWVDITPESREAVDRPGLVAPDGLHPSGEMYAEWVDLMLPSVRRALAR